jgi:hypothetical protein
VKVGAILSVAFVAIVVGGIWLESSERDRQHRAEIQASETAAAAHACEPWKGQLAQYCECTDAYTVWERCESKRVQLNTNSHGVICEHPVYQFHAGDQAEIDAVMAAHKR